MAMDVQAMSVMEYFFMAEIMPRGMPISAVRMALNIASLKVTGRRFTIS